VETPENAEIMQKTLQDCLAKNLRLLVVGINPGFNSAKVGHHYGGSQNHFWSLLYESGIVNRKVTYEDDEKLPSEFQIGFTNLCSRATRSSSELKKKDFEKGSSELRKKLQEWKPNIVCFNGKGIFEEFTRKKCKIGLQPGRICGAQIYVMPSTSPRVRSHQKQDKLKLFQELKSLIDTLQT